MTITYLFAYFFTPAVFHFDVPILNITFAKFMVFTWPCELFTGIQIDVYFVFFPSLGIMYVSAD